jgi:hypothetical protein
MMLPTTTLLALGLSFFTAQTTARALSDREMCSQQDDASMCNLIYRADTRRADDGTVETSTSSLVFLPPSSILTSSNSRHTNPLHQPLRPTNLPRLPRPGLPAFRPRNTVRGAGW